MRFFLFTPLILVALLILFIQATYASSVPWEAEANTTLKVYYESSTINISVLNEKGSLDFGNIKPGESKKVLLTLKLTEISGDNIPKEMYKIKFKAEGDGYSGTLGPGVYKLSAEGDIPVYLDESLSSKQKVWWPDIISGQAIVVLKAEYKSNPNAKADIYFGHMTATAEFI